MPSKKKKYNARFPPARIKKIMQTDEEIGKVAAAVPVIIFDVLGLVGSLTPVRARALELFLESLLTKACHVTQSRNAKTMTTSHLKQCIELEQQFDFLKDLVAAVPDMQGEGDENHAEGAEKIPRRGRKPGSGRKNGGAGAKGKDKKLSGTESEQEDDTEDSETDGEEEDISQPNTNIQPPPHFPSQDMPPQYMPMPVGAPQGTLSMPISSFAPHPSVMGVMPPPPALVPHKDENDDDEDYDS